MKKIRIDRGIIFEDTKKKKKGMTNRARLKKIRAR